MLVDCDDSYLLIDVDQVATAMTSHTGAVLPVHLFGQLARLETLTPVVRDAGIAIVEDAAQAHGARRHGWQAGAMGVAAAFSFYPGKNLGAYGDAGAVVTNDEAVGRRVAALRNHGGERRHQHDLMGFNSRLDTLQAVVLAAKLRHLDRWNEARRAVAQRYQELLDGVPGVRLPGVVPGNDHVWHLYVIRVDARDEVLGRLQHNGVPAGIHYPVPIHRTGVFSALGYRPGAFPVAERAAAEMLSLPMHPHLTRAQQERVVDVLVGALV